MNYLLAWLSMELSSIKNLHAVWKAVHVKNQPCFCWKGWWGCSALRQSACVWMSFWPPARWSIGTAGLSQCMKSCVFPMQLSSTTAFRIVCSTQKNSEWCCVSLKELTSDLYDLFPLSWIAFSIRHTSKCDNSDRKDSSVVKDLIRLRIWVQTPEPTWIKGRHRGTCL